MTVYKMRARDLLLTLIQHVCRLRAALLTQAKQHLETVLIAQTHHQPGQPTTVAHYLAAIDNALARDLERLFAAYGRLNTCPLGAAALAGSSHALDRHFTAQQLGFDAPVSNTYDAVASSDWQVEFVAGAQSVALTLSRFVSDLLAWATTGLYTLSDSLVQGSSIMPQKTESGGLRARTNPVLTNSRQRADGAVLLAQHSLRRLERLRAGHPGGVGQFVHPARRRFGAADGLVSRKVVSTPPSSKPKPAAPTPPPPELADDLTRGYSLSFQEAHRLAGALVTKLCQEGRTLQEADSADLVALGGPSLTAEVLRDALDPERFRAPPRAGSAARPRCVFWST